MRLYNFEIEEAFSLNSDAVTKGIKSATHRALFNALGYTSEEIQRPLVGIVSSQNDIVPGHMNLDKIVEAVKMALPCRAVHR